MKKIILLSVLVAFCYSKSSCQLSIGNYAPDFYFYDNGQRFYLSDFKDRVVLINFWATWCNPCRMELPELESVYNQYSQRSDFLQLCIGVGESRSSINQFNRPWFINKYDLPFIPDENSSVFEAYRGRSIPYTLIIKNNIVQYSSVGYAPELFEEMKQTLANLLR